MDLFTNEPVLTFEKTASQDIGEDATKWGRNILKELFVQVPETADFVPDVQMVKVDEEQGYGLGVIAISNTANDLVLSTPTRVFVPFVIQNCKLSPLDIFMSRGGKFLPLNKSRLRQAMFRPEVFAQVTQDWGSTSLHDMFYPPGRSDNSPGSGVGSAVDGGVDRIYGSGMKMSAADFPLLQTILPTLLQSDIQRLSATFDAHPELLKVAGKNPAMLMGMSLIGEAEGGAVQSGDELIKKAMSLAPTHVMQCGYSVAHEAYWVKTASRDLLNYEATPTYMSRRDFLKFAGDEVTRQVDTDGVVTLTTNATVDSAAMSTNTEDWRVVDAPGIYRVKTVEGNELTGWVIPNLVSCDGTKLPLALFTNGSAAMVQNEILGVHVAAGTELPAHEPKGPGVFYVMGRGGVQATEPLVVGGMESGMDGTNSYHATTQDGEEVVISLVDGVKQMTNVGGTIYLPGDAHFLALDKEVAVPLVARADELTKISMPTSYLRLTGYGDEYGFGFFNMPKLASQVPARQDRDTAVFTLCLAGYDAQAAHNKLAEAAWSPQVLNANDVRALGSELVESTKKEAHAISGKATGLRHYLTKEAAAMPDAMSVDAVLSLGFINSENLRLFTSHIPLLEKALGHVCELLLGARLGLVEIPEGAAARCVRALDDVLNGLKALSMREAEAENE